VTAGAFDDAGGDGPAGLERGGGKASEKIGAAVEKKIQAIRDDAATKITAAELEQATALRKGGGLDADDEPTTAKGDPEDLPPAALAG